MNGRLRPDLRNESAEVEHAARRHQPVRVWFAALLLAVVGAVGAEEARRAMSHADEKLSLDGIMNFGRVNAHLYRGAQPSDRGLAALRALGIDIVVRLSLGEEGGRAEERAVGALGMQFVTFPWSSHHEPTRAQVIGFLTLLRDHPQQRVFVHCKWGADRTGVMVALSRIAFDGWTPARAIDEMEAFHYHSLFLPDLQRFVEAFPADMAADPVLSAFGPYSRLTTPSGPR